MGIDIEELKTAVAEKNTTLEAVADYLKIDRSTLYRKLRRKKQSLTVLEAQKISEFLGLSLWETLDIFWKVNTGGTYMRNRS